MEGADPEDRSLGKERLNTRVARHAGGRIAVVPGSGKAHYKKPPSTIKSSMFMWMEVFSNHGPDQTSSQSCKSYHHPSVQDHGQSWPYILLGGSCNEGSSLIASRPELLLP